jgi:Flp pilus assembly protein TadG
LRCSARLRQERGQALVEFAIVLPIFILLILGILYFGQLYNFDNQATQMAEEAVRDAAVNDNPGSGTLQAYITSQMLSGNSNFSAASVYIYYPSGSSNTLGSPVRACVVLTPTSSFLNVNIGQIVQTATMRIEQVATQWTASTSPPSNCP